MRTVLVAALCLLPAIASPAQVVPWATAIEPTPDAETLPEDRGADGLAQTLRKLGTWASLMMIVAHPDDEDGGMMTYESRGMGARTALLTLTRGEGGQNAMSGDTYDALGLIRTTELLRADQFSGTEQYWGHFADYGFSKTIEEAHQQWGHDRVLYDVVRAVRIHRPVVLASVFLGGVTDGHGHHQVAGEIAQEAFTAAADPNIFPDQIAAGLRPWQPLAVFARTPFAPVTDKGMFDYATGKWAPTRFYNYVSHQWSTVEPSADVQVPEGVYDPILGRSYLQMAREGWGEQRSQYGGGTPPLPGPNDSTYHRFAQSRFANPAAVSGEGFFSGIDITLPGLSALAHPSAADAALLTRGLNAIQQSVLHATLAYSPAQPEKIAPDLRDVYLKTKSLMDAISTSTLSADEKANLNHELGIKLVQANTALVEALGIELHVLVTPQTKSEAAGQNPRVLTVYPAATRTQVTSGESFDVRLHLTSAQGWSAGGKLSLTRTWLSTPEQEHWQVNRLSAPGLDRTGSSVGEAIFQVSVPRAAAATEPYFTRTSIEQPVYTVNDPALLGRSFSPYPVSGWAEFAYDGVPLRVAQVVQTAHRERGRGLVYEPLVVVPQLSVALADRVAILTPGQATVKVMASVTNEASETATGALRLNVPSGWHSEPGQADFTLAPGAEQSQLFVLSPPANTAQEATITASAESGNAVFSRGFRRIGYEGLRPSNLYRSATLIVRPVDVKVAPGLRIGYVMGTGDEVPQAIAQLGLAPHTIDASELATGDLSRYDTIVLGVRTYTAQPALARANPRLLAWVAQGGTLVVQYQGPEFDHDYGPYPISVGGAPERVVDERAPVRLIAASDLLFTAPNQIADSDFAGWMEERGHGFAATWDPRYVAPTETADPGQDPQRGGLLRAPYGRGQYIYVAYALYRQLPEGVPGAWRLLANLISAGHKGNAKL